MIDESTFSAEVRRTLGDLLGKVGYDVTRSDRYSVRFEKPAAFVEVNYDAHRSQELSIWLGDRTEAEPPLEFVDALQATDCTPENLENVALMQTGDPAVLGRLLEHAAGLLSDCGQEFLAADKGAFDAAREFRSRQAEKYTIGLRNQDVLEAADIAWADKDYGRVHDLLNPIRDSLGGAHERRLRFVEKRL